MADPKTYTRLKETTGAWKDMMAKDAGFGVVTVMNAKIFNYEDVKASMEGKTPAEIAASLKTAEFLCELKTLKVANITMEGPTKTITGGQDSTPIVKFGKTVRLEMQDALGNAEAIEALCGGINEYDAKSTEGVFSGNIGLHFGEDFASRKTILGESYLIDSTSGQQVKCYVLIYNMIPDSIFNLTQDAEGDATVFDMNGDLKLQEVMLSDNEGNPYEHEVFYSILPR